MAKEAICSVRVTQEVINKVREKAESQGVTFSELVRQLLRQAAESEAGNARR